MTHQLISQESKLHHICEQILKLDSSVRFAGFINNMGIIITYQYRDGLDPLLKTKECELSFIDTVLRMRIRKDMEPKLGKVLYSLTLYEKVKRVTILPHNEEDPILMVSFDNNNSEGEIYHESLISVGILPLLSY
jgi:hypothetical protein